MDRLTGPGVLHPWTCSGQRSGPPQVLLGLQGQPAFFQAAAHQSADHAVKHGEYRNTQHHAHKAEEAAEQQDGDSTQKEASPVESPRILGPRMLPSNCWSTKMKMTNTALQGLTSRISSAHGDAPMKGRRTG